MWLRTRATPHIFATSCDSDEVGPCSPINRSPALHFSLPSIQFLHGSSSLWRELTLVMPLQVLVWDAHQRRNIMKGSLGFRCRGIAYSQEDYEDPSEGGKATAGKIGGGSTGFHLAVGGKAGRVAILDAENLCPLVILHDSKQVGPRSVYSQHATSNSNPMPRRSGTSPPSDDINCDVSCVWYLQGMDVLRYSPARGNDPSRPGYLAAGSHDLFIYLYNASNNYQFVAKCSGHSGTIETLDWSLPLR